MSDTSAHSDSSLRDSGSSSGETRSKRATGEDRGRFQYSLRCLLAAVALLCLLCGLISWLWQGRAQQAAAKTIIAHGGTVQYTFKHDRDGGLLPDAERPGPRWLRRILGDYFFGSVVFAKATTDSEIEQAGAFVGLRHIELSHTSYGQGALAVTDLGSRITDAGINALASLRGLQTLGMGNVRVTDEQMDSLTRMLTSLRFLSVHSNRLTDKGVSKIARLQQLECLSIGSSEFKGSALADLATLKNIASLHLSGRKIDDTGLTALSLFPMLRELELEGVTAADIPLVAKLERLEKLYLDDADLTVPQRGQVKGFSILRELWLRRSKIDDAAMRYLAGIGQLQVLVLMVDDVTDCGLEELAGLENLKELHLSNPTITDKGIKTVCRLRHLTALSIDSPQITDIGVGYVGSLPNIEKLRLTSTRITDKGAECLMRLRQLHRLDLCGTNVSDEAVARLRSGLPDCEIIASRIGTRSVDDEVPQFQSTVPEATGTK